MKKYVILLLAVIFALGLVACGGEDTSSKQESNYSNSTPLELPEDTFD